jgi:recombination protein RecA
VADEVEKRFDDTLFEVQKRFGTSALRKSSAITPQPSLSTGYLELDHATGIGGVPIGHLTVFIGALTSGKTSLAYRLIACAHRADYAAIYVDLSRQFDPDFAAVCGIDLNKLLLVRPGLSRNPLALIRDLLVARSAAIIVVDATEFLLQTQTPKNDWRSVIDVLRISSSAWLS